SLFLCLVIFSASASSLFFFFHAPAPTEISTLSLHDALPISAACRAPRVCRFPLGRVLELRLPRRDVRAERVDMRPRGRADACPRDRKSTRLNSSHQIISYAVFCLKKKTYKNNITKTQ